MKKKLSTIGIWLLVALSLTSTAFAVYTYISTPNRIADYVQQHKSELKGEKGQDAPARPYVSPFGSNSTPNTNSGSGGFTCSTYGINNQYTSCN